MTKDQTRQKLRAAVVAEAIERGFSATSVGGVVKRAKVSAGTVYVHFENKHDMLRKVYMEIKTEFHETMMAAQAEVDTAAMIRRMWLDMFTFVERAPSDFLYLEYGNTAHIVTEAQQKVVDKMSSEIKALLQGGVDDGTLADIGIETITLLLVAPAMQLARNAVMTKTPVTRDQAELVFARVWRSISP